MEDEPKFDIMKVIVNNKPKTIIIAVVAVLVIVAGGYWFWSKSKQVQKGAPSLGSQIFDKTQNQLEGKVPDINPFETVSNPFKKETNPIRAIYTNPFGEQ